MICCRRGGGGDSDAFVLNLWLVHIHVNDINDDDFRSSIHKKCAQLNQKVDVFLPSHEGKSICHLIQWLIFYQDHN